MFALVDGDIICYSVGFSADKHDLSVEDTLSKVDEFVDDILTTVGADDYNVYLTGKNNFRIKVATTAKYKGNRKGDKPTHFKSIRKHLESAHDAIEVEGLEADDCMGIDSSKVDYPIICTIDKDLDQIPGWHYNWNKRVKYYVDSDKARHHFLSQMLTGDRADNIIGLHRVGPKTAEKWLVGLTYEEGQELVRQKYKEHFPDNWEERLKENAKLLWIRRK